MTPFERFKGIEAFVTTADLGSFTAAGHKLNLTNSAISKGVARLEERLGTRLFERTTRRLVLTDAGSAFYRTCVRVLADLKEAEIVLSTQFKEPVGRLRLDVPEAFGRLHVLPLLLQFTEQHPHLLPHISFTDRFVDLLDEGIDVAVRIGGAEYWPASLGHCYLGCERQIFCASPDYLAKHGTPASVNELVSHDCVLYGKADGSTSPWLIVSNTGLVERKTMEGRIIVGNGEALVSAVKAGYGIAQLATWLVRDDIKRGDLVMILPELSTDGLPLHLIWPIGRQLQPKVNSILELLKKELRINEMH
ncbi:LysR family transcriptional regulator [Xenorhabdus sp. 12]|uniref:LysR family transcriptional regulator n=1 Tax=Xenorhabdus santafensis TaxID=2582833 RepID=A0ABU4S9H2_9GAMM|nr:LysR family transcriptional regulator [Xenorhabdus sp. 12]MDX7987458.1 LysR family transcriptional regulator [Xenorhabdus sp. 12]